jgi:hypothetical protein
MHSGRSGSLLDLVWNIELPGGNYNAASELYCVPSIVVPCLFSRFLFIEANGIMRNLHSLKAEIRFQSPSSIERVSVLAYFDAAHSGTYGQGGYLPCLCIHQLDGKMLFLITD